MDIVEAVKSQRPFKRKGWSEWLNTSKFREKNYTLMQSDLIATDWEIQEPTVSITRSQLFTAISKVANYVALSRGYKFQGPTGATTEFDVDGFLGWDELANELGLNEP